jgi:hypothetical protein
LKWRGSFAAASKTKQRDHGITMPQWKALSEISRNPGITQVELAALTDSDPMTMSGILDRLEKRGFVTRSPDPRDSRAKVVQILPEGDGGGRAGARSGARHLWPRDRRGSVRPKKKCCRAALRTHSRKSRRHVCRRKGKCLR